MDETEINTDPEVLKYVPEMPIQHQLGLAVCVALATATVGALTKIAYSKFVFSTTPIDVTPILPVTTNE